MKFLIFEGIATSGKSTIIGRLAKALQTSQSVVALSEDNTHVPIMERRSELHLEFFKNLIAETTDKNPDIVLVDRLIMTQAYRARVGLKEYEKVESMLLRYDPLTVFLQVQEDAIFDRVMLATAHRNPEWLQYIQTKGEKEQIAEYYISQQRGQMELLRQSTMPYKIFDTTEHDYDEIIAELARLCNK